MKALKQTLAVVAFATAVAVAGSPASAATFTTVTPPGPDGSLSWDFGNTGNIAAGAFTDIFNFVLPSAGVLSGSVQATFTSASNELTFKTVKLDGSPFTPFSLPGLHAASIAMIDAGAGASQIVVTGVSPGLAGSYTGHLTFTPASVPEASTWALMIVGFGGAGAAFRASRRKAAAAA